jgi:hypothetical protein
LLSFVLVSFWVFLSKEGSKTRLKKGHVETFSEKILRKLTKTSMSVFPRFFSVLLRFQVLLIDSAMGVQKHHKKHFTKKIVSKSFYKKIDKNPKPIFSRFCLSRFWAFLGEGSSKTRPKKTHTKI